METTSYASSSSNQNKVCNKDSYQRQADQAVRRKNRLERLQEFKRSIASFEHHSKDCSIGKSAKAIMIGKVLEERAKEISIVAHEIRNIREELNNLKVSGEEKSKIKNLCVNEIEDRENELNQIEEEIIFILESRNQEMVSQNSDNEDREFDSKSNDGISQDLPSKSFFNKKYKCRDTKSFDSSSKPIPNPFNFDSNSDMFSHPIQEDVNGLDDVEDKISFIENLVKADMIKESMDSTLNFMKGLKF